MKTGNGFIECTVRVHKEGKYFVATCEELDVSSFGATQGEALAAVNDAVETHLNALTELGEVWEYLKSRGIEFRSTAASKRKNVEMGPDEMVVRSSHQILVSV